MQIYDADDGGWVVVGGTSEATPLIAAYYALLGSTAQGPSWAYANAGMLNDPSHGANGSCTIAYICQAGAGYDGPTGAGSISGAVSIGGPGTNGSYTESTTATAAQLQGGVYPNDADTTYWWEYGTTTAYGQRTPAVDIGSGNAAVPVSDTLNGLQPDTTYHYRLVAQNSLGTEYGYDFTLSTATGPTNNSSLQQPDSGSGGDGSGSTTIPGTGSTGSTGAGTSTGSGGPTSSSGSSGTSGTSDNGGSAPARPTLSAPRVAAAGASTATIKAMVATGGAGATYSVQYGTTPALGRSVSGVLGASATNLSAALRNLTADRTYYVRVVVTNAAGSATSAAIHFRTSAVTIARVTVSHGKLQAVIRCHGPAQCRVRLQARSGSRLIATGQATIRGNRTATVSLPLTNGQAHGMTLSALSSWGGYPASVTATL
jgi:hypothetical protein